MNFEGLSVCGRKGMNKNIKNITEIYSKIDDKSMQQLCSKKGNQQPSIKYSKIYHEIWYEKWLCGDRSVNAADAKEHLQINKILC